MAIHVLLKEAMTKGSNFVISPLSFHVVLSLIAVGSKGRTLEQLLWVPGSKNPEDLVLLSSQMISIALQSNDEGDNQTAGPTLPFINGVWVAEGFKLKPSFEEVVRGVYSATAKEVDFMNKSDQVRDEINRWAENATNGLIKNLLPERGLERETVLILINALYFKGAWTEKIDASRTEYRDFYLLNGQTVRVPFMTSRKHTYHFYGSFDGFKSLKIPYRNGQDTKKFSMYFFLPDAVYGFENLVNKFKSNPQFFSRQFVMQST
ncbi:hypothetical protein Patl1_21610 [Pistacia atlantica]|uniref:Uncharacterized protein n=1 Tax=Pistacia atlantica TaxID=434234 RepID=A0ACC1BIR4_9ROSI|nr:hypothetical protein Patl1_21610 [Pistacia atlantica]